MNVVDARRGGAAGAEGVRCDLSLLSGSDEAMRERLERAVGEAASLAERWPAALIAAAEPAQLAALLQELAAIRATRTEGEWWAFMLMQTEAGDAATLDIRAWVDDRLPRLDEAIRQFEQAWLELPDERAQALARDDSLLRDRHYLLSLRRFRPFRLAPGEERVLAAREASASTAWKSLYTRTLGSLSARFDDGCGERTWSLSELAARRSTLDRERRRRAFEASREMLASALPVLALCFDSVIADHLGTDRLRGYSDHSQWRNLQNELDASVVEEVLSAAEAHYDLGHRWLRVKGRLLGVERLDSIDRVAPTFETPPIPWEAAERLAVAVFAELTPRLGGEAEAFFRERRIDAELRPGKPAQAFFSIRPSARAPGFIILNWTGTLRNLFGLTHELGHGTHWALAAQAQSEHSFRPGYALAEVPAIFAQLRLLDILLGSGDERLRRAALANALDDAVIDVFMSAAFARFERAAYELRAEGHALTHDRLNELCEAEFAEVWGDAMTDELGIRQLTWAGSPFIYERFYTYGYVFAFLLATALVARSRDAGFGSRYERFLAAGGSDSPENLLSSVDLDLRHRGLWDEGFAVIESWLAALADDPANEPSDVQ